MKKDKVELIKPNKNKKKDSINFINPLILLILGIILLTNSSKVVIMVIYFIASIFLVYGIYNLISYSQTKKNLNIIDSNKLVLGVSTFFIALVIFILAASIDTFLRFIIGIILIYNGFKNIFDFLNFKSYFSLGVGILLTIMGIYTITCENIILQIIGCLLIIASVIDFLNLLEKK